MEVKNAKLDIPTPAQVQKDLGNQQKHQDAEDQSRFMLLSKGAYNVYYYGSAGRERGIQKAQKELSQYLPTHTILPEFSDDESVVYKHDHKDDADRDITIAYRGTDVKNYKDIFADMSILGGMIKSDLYDNPMPRFQRALSKYDRVRTAYPDDIIQTTGHSLGGTMALLVGKKRDAHAYGFNVGSSPLDFIKEGTEARKQHHKATIFHTYGDPVSASNYFLDKTDKIIATAKPDWKNDLYDVIKAGGMGMYSSFISSANPYTAAAVGSTKAGVAALGKINKYHSLENFAPPAGKQLELKSDIPFKQSNEVDLDGDFHPLTDFMPVPKHDIQEDWAFPTLVDSRTREPLDLGRRWIYDMSNNLYLD